jgi:ribosomal protein S18 acetylase RimI-like enzyme
MSLVYQIDDRPAAAEINELYEAAQLRRPRDEHRLGRMFEASPLVLTARAEGRLVGALRGWTDGAFDGYVCDLAVHPHYQKRGIGRELLRRCIVAHSSEVQWVLRASIIAAEYYSHIGWKRIENGWYWSREG